MVTKPKPRERPVDRSIIRLASSDGAVRGKRVLQVVFCGVEGKISYEQFIILM